jgi:small-conductance mechanosensitive channel
MKPVHLPANESRVAAVSASLEVEPLAQQKDFAGTPKQTRRSRPIGELPSSKLRIWLYTLLLGATAMIYYLVGLRIVALPAEYIALGQRLIGGSFLMVLVLLGANLISIFAIRRINNRAARYNLNRVVKLIVTVALSLIILAVLFADWYTTIVSIGLISLFLGFALQKPITSFIGWLYLLIRKPYQVGDRIRIGEASGDVVDVGYLDTTLWEFGGPLLSTDHSSGRIIKFPNSKVLDEPIYNYSWPQFPYIWNEIRFHVGYDSDLQFVAETMQKAVEEELGKAMVNRVELFRDLLARTPVDELQVRRHPAVIFRPGENMWIEAIVRYLVTPREAGSVKNRLVMLLLDRLNAQPDRTRFPKGNLRWG